MLTTDLIKTIVAVQYGQCPRSYIGNWLSISLVCNHPETELVFFHNLKYYLLYGMKKIGTEFFVFKKLYLKWTWAHEIPTQAFY